MKIMVVAFNDGDNLAIENVLRELEKRGHEITIFATFQEENTLRMFSGLRAEIRPVQEITPNSAKQFDVAFSTPMRMFRLKVLDIYCFVYAPYVTEYFMTERSHETLQFSLRLHGSWRS